MSVSVLLEKVCPSIGEGPHWDEKSQSLLYLDIESGEIHRYNATTGQDAKIKLDGTVGHIIPRASGGYIVGLGHRLVAVDWDTQTVTSLAEVEHGKETRFNDGKCDPSGRLWAGTMGLESSSAVVQPDLGTLYSLETNCSLKARHGPVSISNGLAWSEDQRSMYYIDSLKRQVHVFDFDIGSGDVSNIRVVADVNDAPIAELGYPDGMCIDTEGKLWVACFYGSKVIRIDPETGSILRKVELPAARITSCCFGGPSLDELFVTSSTYCTTPEEEVKYPLAGSVFKVTGLGVKGTPGYAYQG